MPGPVGPASTGCLLSSDPATLVGFLLQEGAELRLSTLLAGMVEFWVMAAQIDIEKRADGTFQVTVVERDAKTSHRVTLESRYYQSLTGGKISPEELIRQSFAFLLKREPKESILERFDLSVISRYFPEYEREIKKRLSK
jgi:hypothetical protein